MPRSSDCSLDLALSFILAAVLTAGSAHAAGWTEGGLSLGGYELNPGGAISDGADGVIVCWEDRRDGPYPNHFDVYAQRWDSAGIEQWTADGEAQWADQGVQATPGGPFMGNLQVVPDGLGRVVMVWVDYRAGENLVYAQRLDGTGTPQWPGDILVPDAEGAHYTPVAMETLDGGAVIAWVSGPSYNRNVYAQRLDASGARLWNGGVATAVCEALQSQ